MTPNIAGRSYVRLNKIELSKSALLSNHRLLKSLQPSAAVCPVLKSNAYGHGLKELAPLFDRLKPPFLVVDSLYEAYELHKLKVRTPILILGYTHPDNFRVKRLPFHFALSDLGTAKALNTHQPGCPVHIFVDTGMHREGISIRELPSFIRSIRPFKLNVVGLASHFADADNPKNDRHTLTQIQNYKIALSILEKAGIHPQWRHIAASGGALKVKDDMFNMMRIGLSSYGISPLHKGEIADRKIHLQPVLSLKSTIAHVKAISAGSNVGYNGTFVAKKEMKIAILPIGYHEGVNRALSNRGFVKVRGKYCPIIGLVSMNMTTIDVTSLPTVKVGDEVIVYSRHGKDRNSIQNASRLAGISPYILLANLAQSIHRKVIS